MGRSRRGVGTGGPSPGRGAGGGGGGGGAQKTVAENGGAPVLSVAGVADIAAVQPAGELQAPVPAACRLEQVPAEGAHRPELWRRREPAGLAERIRDLRVDLELCER